MGAYICTLSEWDWETTRNKGIYGNRFYKEGTTRVLGDTQQLSIIRDLISMRNGDLLFFHIRREQSIHGVYQVREEPFFDEDSVWADKTEKFPYRFLFQPHTDYQYLCQNDANIEVHALYELIDKGKIKSLVTLEREINIEGRSVKRILMDDAKEMIGLLHRDFRWRFKNRLTSFAPYNPTDTITSLKDKIYKVGNNENAIKAVILYGLARNDNEFLNLKLPTNYDFANEFFIAQTTRKSVDILCLGESFHHIMEVKTDRCDEYTLTQALYYRDLLRQRKWVGVRDKILISLIGKRFTNDIVRSCRLLNRPFGFIQLIEYIPTNLGKWASIRDVTPSY